MQSSSATRCHSHICEPVKLHSNRTSGTVIKEYHMSLPLSTNRCASPSPDAVKVMTLSSHCTKGLMASHSEECELESNDGPNTFPWTPSKPKWYKRKTKTKKNTKKNNIKQIKMKLLTPSWVVLTCGICLISILGVCRGALWLFADVTTGPEQAATTTRRGDRFKPRLSETRPVGFAQIWAPDDFFNQAPVSLLDFCVVFNPLPPGSVWVLNLERGETLHLLRPLS